MFNWKKIMVLGAVVASLFVTSIPAQAAEFEEADYVKTTSYKEAITIATTGDYTNVGAVGTYTVSVTLKKQ